jgi:hypothetical protein
LRFKYSPIQVRFGYGPLSALEGMRNAGRKGFISEIHAKYHLARLPLWYFKVFDEF